MMKPKCCRLVRGVHKDNNNLRKDIPEKICIFGDNVIIFYLTGLTCKILPKLILKVNVDVLNTVNFRLLHRCVSVMVNFQIYFKHYFGTNDERETWYLEDDKWL